VRELDLGAAAEQLAHHVSRIADARRAVGELAGLRPRRRQERLQGLEARAAAYDQAETLAARQQHQRRETLDRIVGQLAAQHGVGGMAAGREQHRGSVGPGARDFQRTDAGAAARLVVDHDAAAGRQPYRLAEHARRIVGSRTGGKGHDDAQVAFLRDRGGRQHEAAKASLDHPASRHRHDGRPWIAFIAPASVRAGSATPEALRQAT
jgi:hypothetical protein